MMSAMERYRSTYQKWETVVFPGNLRNQFLTQFGERLEGHLCRSDDRFKDITIPEILHAFDMADKHIGQHWTYLATNLWRYGSHTLLSCYFETSGKIADAMRGLLSTTTSLYPVFSTTSEITSDGLVVRVRPTFDLGERHWGIFLTLALLSESEVFKRFASEEMKGIVYNVSMPSDVYSETFRNLARSQINFNVPIDETFAFYPLNLLQKPIGVKNPALNKTLFNEIQAQTALPHHEDSVLNELERLIFATFPNVLTASEAAVKLNISRRTLQRRLERRKRTYAEFLLNLRREHVLIYLARAAPDSAHHLELGFPSERALKYFCRVNFGLSLVQLRNKSNIQI